MRQTIPILLALALAGCAARATLPPPVAALDTGLTRACDPKPIIPKGADKVGLPERAIVMLITRYEVRYDDCAARFAKAIKIIEKRDAALAGRR